MIIVCPECKAEFEVPDDLIGKEASCPCGNSFTIEQRKCPFCGEMVKAEAVKCRFCQSMLDDSNPQKDLIYRVLCLLGGMIGIHDLYAGSGYLAGLKLLLTLMGAMFFRAGGWIVLILVALFCIADLIRGMPKKKQQTVSPRKRILIAFTVMIVVVLLAVLILFCHFSRGA